LKELGQTLKETREKMGVSIEEAAEDLNLRPSQLENIEEGNIKAFKDVFYLKYFIRDYAKYLGLDFEKLLEEFNDFLFDYTSKIPLDAIKKANEEKNKNNKSEVNRKIASPYTLSKGRKFMISPMYVYIAIFILVILIVYLLIKQYGNSTDQFNNSDLTKIQNYDNVLVV
jgi:cytoskeletal protein RodZ